MTLSRAGGLLGERLKGTDNPVSRPRRLYPSQPHLFVKFARLLLLTDVRSDHRFVQAHMALIIPWGMARALVFFHRESRLLVETLGSGSLR